MKPNTLHTLFLSVLSSTFIFQQAAFAFDLEELRERDNLHVSITTSDEYAQAEQDKSNRCAPFQQRIDEHADKENILRSSWQTKTVPLQQRLQDSETQRDKAIAQLKEEFADALEKSCASLFQQREKVEKALAEAKKGFKKDVASLHDKITQIEKQKQLRASFHSKNSGAGRTTVFLHVLDSEQEEGDTKRDLDEISQLNAKIAVIRQQHLGEIEKRLREIDAAVEREKDRSEYQLAEHSRPFVEKHAEVQREIEAALKKLEEDYTAQKKDIPSLPAGFKAEATRQSTAAFWKLMGVYHDVKRKFRPNYPRTKDFLDSADRAVISSFPQEKKEEKKEESKASSAS